MCILFKNQNELLDAFYKQNLKKESRLVRVTMLFDNMTCNIGILMTRRTIRFIASCLLFNSIWHEESRSKINYDNGCFLATIC
mgnify:CR=1 FL=1